MSFNVTVGRRELPIGLPSLAQVQGIADAANGYASRAEAAVANVPALVKTLRAGALAYRRDPNGTALTTADGQKWSPEGAITPQHFGAAADGETDDVDPVMAALEHAAARTGSGKQAFEGVDLRGKTYALSEPLVISTPISISGGYLVAADDFPVGEYLVRIDPSAVRARVSDIWGEGSGRANIVLSQAQGAKIINVHGRHFPNYGARIQSATDMQDCTFYQWEWSDPERLVWANRTAVGISVEHADSTVTGTNAATCLVPFRSSTINLRLLNSHFWNAGATDAPVEVDCAAFDNAEANVIVGNYFDNGRVRIATKFGHTFTGNVFVRNADGANRTPIFTESAAVNEDLAGLVITGNTFIGQFPDGLIQFGGSGTYVSDERKKMDWTANQRSGGTGSNWKEFKHKDKLTLSGANADFSYSFDGYYNLNFAAGARIRAAQTDADAKNVSLMFGEQEAHRFTPNQYNFGIGLSTSGGSLMQIMSSGTNGFAFHPASASGTIDYNAGLSWLSSSAAWRFNNGRVHLAPVSGQTYSEIRGDRSLRFEADWDADNTANRIMEFVFAGTVRHRFIQTGIEVGSGYGPSGSGYVARIEAATGGILRISPSNGAGGFDPAKAIEWDGTRWSIRGGRVALPSLPTTATGLTAGDVWVDAAAGNVLKVV